MDNINQRFKIEEKEGEYDLSLIDNFKSLRITGDVSPDEVVEEILRGVSNEGSNKDTLD
jgi:hypothetical protein